MQTVAAALLGKQAGVLIPPRFEVTAVNVAEVGIQLRTLPNPALFRGCFAVLIQLQELVPPVVGTIGDSPGRLRLVIDMLLATSKRRITTCQKKDWYGPQRLKSQALRSFIAQRPVD